MTQTQRAKAWIDAVHGWGWLSVHRAGFNLSIYDWCSEAERWAVAAFLASLPPDCEWSTTTFYRKA